MHTLIPNKHSHAHTHSVCVAALSIRYEKVKKIFCKVFSFKIAAVIWLVKSLFFFKSTKIKDNLE